VGADRLRRDCGARGRERGGREVLEPRARPALGGGVALRARGRVSVRSDGPQARASAREGPRWLHVLRPASVWRGFALAYYALVELYAGFGQILLSLVPLATLLLAAAQGEEQLHRASLAGTLLALVGVVVISGASLRESIPILSLLSAIGSALCFAQAAIIVRRLPPVDPVSMSAIGMAVGAVVLLLGSTIAGEKLALPRQAETLVAFAFLVLIGSVVVFILYLFVLRYWAASRAAYGFVLTTVVTVALSAWLDDEPISVALIAGGALVLVGVYIGALRSPAAEATARAVHPESQPG
jgi:drug/metabolite transporter (DMT)-like permease